jgi:type IV pilus assembly protein PilY1
MIPQIKKLRESYGVITLFVAYGGGIDSSGMEKFDLAAVAGSCNKAGDDDCKPTIVADNPSALLTKLKSEVERIIASRLSFSAPQITANIEGDGDLYQAQFEYTQHREWTGHLVRKKVGEQNNIDHDLDKAYNWDAAITVQAQAAGNRKIWTVLPGADYIDADWNNFTTKNATKIDKLFSCKIIPVSINIIGSR